MAGVVFLLTAWESANLYAYAFPLLGSGAAYCLQFRSIMTRPWWITFVAITPLSVVALACPPSSPSASWRS